MLPSTPIGVLPSTATVVLPSTPTGVLPSTATGVLPSTATGVLWGVTTIELSTLRPCTFPVDYLAVKGMQAPMDSGRLLTCICAG